MPLDFENLKGTEKEGVKSNHYCRFCYEKGSFKEPNMTSEEMELNLRNQMERIKSSDELIENSLDILPSLKRWRNKELVL